MPLIKEYEVNEAVFVTQYALIGIRDIYGDNYPPEIDKKITELIKLLGNEEYPEEELNSHRTIIEEKLIRRVVFDD